MTTTINIITVVVIINFMLLSFRVRSLSVRSFVHCLITIIHVLLFMFFLYYCRFVYVYMNLYSFFLCLLFCLYGFYNRHFRHRSSFYCDVEREKDIFQIARSSFLKVSVVLCWKRNETRKKANNISRALDLGHSDSNVRISLKLELNFDED